MTLWEAGDPAIEASAAHGAGEVEVDETWTLPELGRAVQRALAMAVPREIWVRGEIRGLRRANSNGNRYFELVAPGATPDARPLAKFGATLLKRDAPRVNARLAAAAHSTRLADGVEVRVRVRVDWWTPNGQLSLLVVDIDPAFTLGRLEAQRAEVLAALQRGGLLRRNAEQPLSPLPLRVGLVTSLGSAAYEDFVKEIDASGYRFRISAVDARMQGTAAPAAIASAIASFGADSVDVVALVRGGGARTDLATFDGFAVAEAVAMCPVPVFCGIGHEIDRCVVDEVAHTSTKTPTACAAALVEQVARAEQRAERLWARTAQLGLRHLARADHSLAATSDRVGRSGKRAVQVAGTRNEQLTAALRGAVLEAPERASHRLSRRTGRAEGAARQHLRVLEERLAHSTARLVTCAPARTRSQETRVAAAHDRLQALDPARILARGWSITRTADGAVARDAAVLEPGAGLVTTLQHGTVTSTVAPDPGSPREATDVR